MVAARDDEPLGPAEPRSFSILVGARSGRSKLSAKRDLLARALEGQPYDVLPVTDPRTLARVARQAAERAARRGAALVVFGGDGTIGAVAAEALRARCAFGVVPGGTFNYFARTHGISEDAEVAARGLLTARIEPVQVGLLNGQVFLVNASVGLYPDLLEEREHLKARWGRSRWTAAGAALLGLAREHRQLLLEFDHDGVRERHRTPGLLVDNNRLQLEQIGIDEVRALEAGRLPAVMLEPMDNWGLLRVLVRSALGELGKAPGVRTFSFERLEVRPGRGYGRRRLKVGLDGEVSWQSTPLVFEVAPQPLHLLLPRDAEGAT